MNEQFVDVSMIQQLFMGSQNTKIDTQKVNVGEIQASSPTEVSKFSAPFRKFSNQYQKVHGNTIQSILSIEEPYHGQFSITQSAYSDLQDAFEAKTKDIEIQGVLFDEQYTDHFTYMVKDDGDEYALQLRPFSNFETHAFNNILCEVYLHQEIKKLNCSNLNTLADQYVIQTGLESEGEEFPNTQILILEPIATNLSEIIRYRRENKWFWTVAEFNSLAWDLTNAVAELHRAGISHNDIRPCNVYFSLEKNCYQLGTFSNALKSGSNEKMIGLRTSSYFGAPELSNTVERDLSQADIYSLGMTLLCAFYLCEPIDRKNSTPYNRHYEQKYDIMSVIREMIAPAEKRRSIETIMKKISKGAVSTKMKTLIQSLRYKHMPKDMKLIKTKKAFAEGYLRLGLWNQWKDTVSDTYQLEEYALDESKKANALSELAKIQYCRGESQSASQFAKRASKIYRYLGYRAFDLGNYGEAIGFHSKAINASKYFDNENDLEIAKNLQGLAMAHSEKGDYEVAKPLVNESGIIIAKTVGKDSVDYCKSKMYEAKIQTDFGEFESANEILSRCLVMADKKVFQNDELGSKLKADVLQEMGKNLILFSAYSDGDKADLLKRAQRHIAESVTLNERFPDNHIALAKNVQSFGEIEMKKENYKDAKSDFVKAEKMREAYLRDKKKEGTMEKEKADNLCNVAACQTALKQQDKALKSYQSALNIYKSLYGSNHNKFSAIAIGKMSRVYQNLGEVAKSKECLQLATEILEELHGKQDPDYEYFKKLQDSL